MSHNQTHTWVVNSKKIHRSIWIIHITFNNHKAIQMWQIPGWARSRTEGLLDKKATISKAGPLGSHSYRNRKQLHVILNVIPIAENRNVLINDTAAFSTDNCLNKQTFPGMLHGSATRNLCLKINGQKEVF